MNCRKELNGNFGVKEYKLNKIKNLLEDKSSRYDLV